MSGGCALAIAVALAGCGSYTKHDFVAQANAICAHTVQQLRALPAPTGTGQRALAPYLARAVPLVQAESRQLHGLRRPPGSPTEQRLLTLWLSAERLDATTYAALREAVVSADADAFGTAVHRLSTDPAGGLARAYGIDDCSGAIPTIR